MKRALVTGCNTKFLNGAKGLLRSVRMFHPEVSRYCLAPDAELDEVRAQLGELATVVVAPRKVSGVPDQWLMQLLAARIFIPTFPEDVVAWVDSDAIFCASAPELWEVPVGKVNVVRDAVYDIIHMVPMDTWDVFERQFGYARNHPGFNAGIYALRSADWRDLPERYEKALATGDYPYYPSGFDQALLNGLLLPHANWLPRAFNCHAIYELGIQADTRIIHYTASPKPWQPGYGKHNPGYPEWAIHGESAQRARAARLRAYYRIMIVRRLGYRIVRKILTKTGIWTKEIGVANGGCHREIRSSSSIQG